MSSKVPPKPIEIKEIPKAIDYTNSLIFIKLVSTEGKIFYVN